MSLEVLAINASIGNSKLQWSMEDLSDGSMEEPSSPLSLSCSCSSFEHEEPDLDRSSLTSSA